MLLLEHHQRVWSVGTEKELPDKRKPLKRDYATIFSQYEGELTVKNASKQTFLFMLSGISVPLKSILSG